MSIQLPNVINNITTSQIVTQSGQACVPANLLDQNFSALANPINPVIPVTGSISLSTANSGNIYELNAPSANATITLPTPTNGYNNIFVGNNSSSYTYTFTTPSGIIQYGGYTGTSASIVVNGGVGKQYYLASDGTNYFVFETSNSYIIPRNTVVFTSSGTWTVPQGVTKILVSGCGGGAAGTVATYNSSTSYFGGTGGGAGNVTIKQSISVIPGHTLSITIGGAGTSGNAGGITSLVDSTTSTTLLNLSGGSTNYSFGLTSGQAYGGWGGPGESSAFGIGGLSGNTGNGGNALGWGSGGGGGGGINGSYAGGNGAPGILIIEW